MKLAPASARLRIRRFRAASLAAVFLLQILSLCLCLPAAAEEHDCCPPTSRPELPDAVTVANLSTLAATSCCPDDPGMRAVLRLSERDLNANHSAHAVVVAVWPLRSYAQTRPHTGSVVVEREPPVRRSPILRI